MEQFAGLTLLELQAMLAAAIAAYNRVILGESVRIAVDRSGERVEFNPTNQQALVNYMAQLRAAIARLEAGVSPIAGRPLQFTFP